MYYSIKDQKALDIEDTLIQQLQKQAIEILEQAAFMDCWQCGVFYPDIRLENKNQFTNKYEIVLYCKNCGNNLFHEEDIKNAKIKVQCWKRYYGAGKGC